MPAGHARHAAAGDTYERAGRHVEIDGLLRIGYSWPQPRRCQRSSLLLLLIPLRDAHAALPSGTLGAADSRPAPL
eukprot:860373-Heterocapsa_arctica.AAC.1